MRDPSSGRRRTLLIIAILLAGIIAHDVAVPVESELSTRSLIASIQLYRRFVSPRMGTLVQCRFDPTCSVYGLESVKRYGAIRGGWRTLKRITKCTPGTPLGTNDPP